jgi:phenylacetic acid degradation operon negative regulatory protein
MSTRTQDLIFTLFGDYISHRGDTVWIGALIELLQALGTSEQAVRSTASRMARKGWLHTARRGRVSYYSMTPRMAGLLQKGSQQIYYPAQDAWDGHWYLLTYALSDNLEDVRHELRKRVSWLGFGRLGNGTWISPRDRHAELLEILQSLNIKQCADYFRADHVLPADNGSLVQRCWDLAGLNQRYHSFIQKHQPQFERDCLTEQNGGTLGPEYVFRQRFWLVHEYRYFPFSDPYLPHELLPEDWLGRSAINLFRAYHDLLRDKANAYVDEVLARTPYWKVRAL